MEVMHIYVGLRSWIIAQAQLVDCRGSSPEDKGSGGHCSPTMEPSDRLSALRTAYFAAVYHPSPVPLA